MALFKSTKNEYEMDEIEPRSTQRKIFTERRNISGVDCTIANKTRFQMSTPLIAHYNSTKRLPSQHFSNVSRKATNCLEVCIYLKNKLGVTLELEDGEIATVDEMLHIVFSEREVGLSNPVNHKIFALWLSSPLLEVQLKPHHLPYKIHQQWTQLLQKYTSASREEIENDVPVLFLQRNAFYAKKNERKLDDPDALSLLYEESRDNILNGRYPCEEVNYYTLAALQAGIELGPFNPNIHTLNFFRTKIKSFLPKHLCKFRWFFKFNFNAKSGPESSVLEQYCNIPASTRPDKLKKKYLEFCWTLPYYGSAFFQGQIEKPGNFLSSLIGNQDLKVLVAINSEGVYIISQEENIMLLGLNYEELCWECIKPTQPENYDCFPCLYLQFQVTENGGKVWKIMQVFSKQAVMMDALISTFVDELKERKNWKKSRNIGLQNNSVDADEIDIGNGSDLLSDALVPLTKAIIRRTNSSVSCISNKIHRLSLATFNEDGDCINQMGSLAFSNQ